MKRCLTKFPAACFIRIAADTIRLFALAINNRIACIMFPAAVTVALPSNVVFSHSSRRKFYVLRISGSGKLSNRKDCFVLR